jgi:hypothetical protein
MSQVSEGGAELFTQLVEWEMFGREACPKELLRGVPLSDLSIASRGLEERGGLGEFISSQMIEMEMLFRSGRIQDWSYTREGDHVTLSIDTKHAAKVATTIFGQEATA